MKKKIPAQKKNTKAEHAFFKGIPPAFKKEILAGSEIVRLLKGSQIFVNGTHARGFYLLLSGKVSILAEEQDVRFDPELSLGLLQMLGPGDVVGWSWLIPPYQWRFNAAAETNVTLIAIDGARLRRRMEKDHALAYHIYRKLLPVMNERLVAARLKLQMFGAKPFAAAEGG